MALVGIDYSRWVTVIAVSLLTTASVQAMGKTGKVECRVTVIRPAIILLRTSTVVLPCKVRKVSSTVVVVITMMLCDDSTDNRQRGVLIT